MRNKMRGIPLGLISLVSINTGMRFHGEGVSGTRDLIRGFSWRGVRVLTSRLVTTIQRISRGFRVPSMNRPALFFSTLSMTLLDRNGSSCSFAYTVLFPWRRHRCQ